jgi:hypothetical protein
MRGLSARMVELAVGIAWRTLTFSEGLRYWKEQLDGLSVVELPTNRSRPHQTSSGIAARRSLCRCT